ncbi:YidH family protein [Nocardioides sp. SYSU DS0663]|uniref:YidH family protein n=1 Tax=Nocardioides sp. SYSU DS0663 TaxID=3416445 RepID=UPI003F4CA71C
MGVYDVGSEPDPRFTLANERTFLAWVRTSLAVLAGAVALHSLGVPEPPWLRRALVVALLVLGGGTTALAYRRWALVERALRTGRPLPRFGLGAVVTGAVLVAATLLAVTVALG